MIETKNIGFGYEKSPVLKDISLTLEKGQIYGLAGVNGSGKTTLLKILGRLLDAEGEIYLEGKSYKDYERCEFAKKVAYLPQTRSIPSITVGQLVSHGRFPYLGFSRIMTSADKEAIEKALCMTELENMRSKNLKNLSGGERQRAYIAMTLAQDADYVLLDEPTTHLDICHKFEIMNIIKQIKDSGKTVVAVLHDLELSCKYSDRMILLKDGRIYGSDTPHSLMKKGMLRDVFNVECTEYFKDGDTEYVFSPVK